MKQYDRLAKFYDKVISGKEETAPYIISRLRKFSPETKEILELGCGTGDVLRGLTSRYGVTGIDSSKEMLRIARRKLPEAKFHLGDICELVLPKTFDAVICVYDTINHLTTFTKWKRLFANAFKMLNENGVFIFDVNSSYKLHMLENVTPLLHRFGKSILIMDVSRISPNVYNWNLKVFDNLKGNNFDLTECNISESVFEASKIIDGLEKNFEILRIEDESGRKITPETERIYFVCRKKS